MMIFGCPVLGKARQNGMWPNNFRYAQKSEVGCAPGTPSKKRIRNLVQKNGWETFDFHDRGLGEWSLRMRFPAIVLAHASGASGTDEQNLENGVVLAWFLLCS